jgi:hypothetical protein
MGSVDARNRISEYVKTLNGGDRIGSGYMASGNKAPDPAQQKIIDNLGTIASILMSIRDKPVIEFEGADFGE